MRATMNHYMLFPGIPDSRILIGNSEPLLRKRRPR